MSHVESKEEFHITEVDFLCLWQRVMLNREQPRVARRGEGMGRAAATAAAGWVAGLVVGPHRGRMRLGSRHTN